MSLLLRFSSDSPLPVVFPYAPKRSVSLTFPAHGRTKQSFRDECDVNRIMARYLETGILEGDSSSARFADVVALQELDYQGAMNFVIGAQEAFGALPSSIRSRFRNDPGELLAFLDNPANQGEAIRLGLVADPAAPAATVPLGTPAPAAGTVAAGA